MSRRVARVALTALFAALSPGLASTQHGDVAPYRVYSMVSSSCASWIQMRRELGDTAVVPAKRVLYPAETHWVSGFLSGVSFASKVDMKPATPDEIEKAVDEYCGRNPGTQLSDAAIALAGTMSRATGTRR